MFQVFFYLLISKEPQPRGKKNLSEWVRPNEISRVITSFFFFKLVLLLFYISPSKFRAANNYERSLKLTF